MTELIYHICRGETWQAAMREGAYRGSEDDLRDGFIHFSTGGQIAESARRHRAGQAGLVLIAVDPDRLGGRLKWEKSRAGALFPHLYGTLLPSEIASARPLPLGPDGLHLFPPL